MRKCLWRVDILKSRALCVMCIGGGKYLDQYNLVKPMMQAYADRCGADLVLIDQPLDETNRRSVFSQKLLIPDYLKAYEVVAFLDLDIIITPGCPDIFQEIPQGCGLAAVLNPRGTEKFRKMFAENERILNETVMDYFTSRNFPADDRLVGNINGGVLVFRPALIADYLKDYYYSEHSQGSISAYEEAPMAYYSQVNGLFHGLDERFNLKVNFEVGTPIGEDVYRTVSSRGYRLAEKVMKKLTHRNNVLLEGRLTRLVTELAKTGYIIHFNGGYWNPRVYGKCMENIAGGQA